MELVLRMTQHEGVLVFVPLDQWWCRYHVLPQCWDSSVSSLCLSWFRHESETQQLELHDLPNSCCQLGSNFSRMSSLWMWVCFCSGTCLDSEGRVSCPPLLLYSCDAVGPMEPNIQVALGLDTEVERDI